MVYKYKSKHFLRSKHICIYVCVCMYICIYIYRYQKIRNWHILPVTYGYVPPFTKLTNLRLTMRKMLHSVCILLFRLLPESPRWLIVKGRNEEANIILHQFAKVNKTAYPAEELDITLVKPTSIIIVFFRNIAYVLFRIK